MIRREFITLLGGAAAAWPLTARAQLPERVRRIGVLMGLPENDPDTDARLAGFREALERLGWLEGHNIRIDYRFAPAGAQAPVRAKELVALQPDVILANSTPVTAALQRETRTIPIVFTGLTADPISEGFVTSLARPGGNLTGLLLFETSVNGKWLAMLKEIASRLARAAFVVNPKTAPYYVYHLRAAEAAASSLGIELVFSPIGTTAAEIEGAIESFARVPNGGLIILPSAVGTQHREAIASAALRHRLPSIYSLRMYPLAGGLMSYGVARSEPYSQAATYVDRILKGAKPAELPVQAAAKCEMVFNLKTAKALGLTVPDTLLARADEVIE